MRGVVLAAVMVAFALGGSAPAADDEMAKKYPALTLEGKAAPEFTADFAINGMATSLEGMKGKVVLLDFWAVWCGPCRAVFPELTKLHEKYGKEGLQIVGMTRFEGRFESAKDGKLVMYKPEDKTKKLSKDVEKKMLEDFVKHYKLPYLIQTVSPEDNKKYKITAIPTAMLIDKKGKIQMVKIGSGKANLEALEEKIKELIKE